MTPAILEQPQTLTARELLRAATAEFEAKRDAAQSAEDVIDRAQAAVDKAKSILHGFNDLPDRIQAFHVAALKAGKDLVLPPEIRDQQREHLYAREQFEYAMKALQTVQGEFADAQEAMAAASKAQEDAALQVVLGRAREVAYRLAAANEERLRLRLVLASLTAPYGGDAAKEDLKSFVAQSLDPETIVDYDLIAKAFANDEWRPKVIALKAAGISQFDAVMQHYGAERGLVAEAWARDNDRFNRLPADSPAIVRAAAYWQNFAGAVLNDPSAEPDPLPSWKELWE